LAFPIGGSAYSSWPTLRVTTNGGNGNPDRATNWKTPHGMANVDRNGKSGGAGGGEFAKQANNWKTPDANCMKGSAQPGQRLGQLDEQAEQLWRTPSDPTKRGGSQPVEKRLAGGHTVNLEDQAEHPQGQKNTNAGAQSSPKPRGSRPRLNVVFVEWLMGFPFLWTRTDDPG